MKARKMIFNQKDPYEWDDELFLKAMRENLSFQIANCQPYAELCESIQFHPEQLQKISDLATIPLLSTLFFKRNRLFSMPEESMVIKATSSGTKGLQSQVGFDRETLNMGIRMMIRYFRYYGILSFAPTNYLILGYEPSKHSSMGAIKTAYGVTKFAPALHREYALKDTGTGYEINFSGVQKALTRYAKQPFPVRFVGFPSYMYFLVKQLKELQIQLKLHHKSKVILGGGWKQYADQEIDREEFYELIDSTLGIKRNQCFEFYSAVEHPLPYCKCREGHFHIPAYSRVIIRDILTLQPLPPDQPGLLSFVTPLVNSMPLAAVITDDLATYSEETCSCGNKTPYFDLIGRSGVGKLRTCTVEAAELLTEQGGNI